MRIIFYNKAGVFFVSARLPCLRACVPGLPAWPGLAWAWPAGWPGCLAAKNAQRRSTRQAHHIDAHVLLMARDCPLCKQA